MKKQITIVCLIIYLTTMVKSKESEDGFRDPCYITNWRYLKRYYIKRGSFMHNKTYDFYYRPKGNSSRLARKFTFQICKSDLKVPSITIDRTYSWSVYTEKSENEAWQAGEIGQLYGNLTLDYTSEFEDPNFIRIIPTVVNKSVLKTKSGVAVFHDPNPDFSYFYLYTDELEERTLYIQDDMKRSVACLAFGILICSVAFLFGFEEKILNVVYPVRWLTSSLLLAWLINFYNQMNFPKNNTLVMSILIFVPLFSGFAASLSKEISLVMFYLIFILSLFDVACYLSFITGFYNYIYLGLLSWYIVKRGSTLRPVTNETIHEWMLCCIVAIESSIYFCSTLHFNPLIGGLLEITEGVYLGEMEALAYISVFIGLNLFISEFRLRIVKKKKGYVSRNRKGDLDFYSGITEEDTNRDSDGDEVEVMSV